MNRIVGQSRQQVEFGCLEDAISPDNSVRVMDAFVDKLDLNKLGFVQREIKSEGLEKVNEEHSFICFVNNFIRAIKIGSVNSILEKIKNWEPNYRAIVRLMKISINYDQIRLIKFCLRAIYSCEILNSRSIKMA